MASRIIIACADALAGRVRQLDAVLGPLGCWMVVARLSWVVQERDGQARDTERAQHVVEGEVAWGSFPAGLPATPSVSGAGRVSVGPEVVGQLGQELPGGFGVGPLIGVGHRGVEVSVPVEKQGTRPAQARFGKVAVGSPWKLLNAMIVAGAVRPRPSATSRPKVFRPGSPAGRRRSAPPARPLPLRRPSPPRGG